MHILAFHTMLTIDRLVSLQAVFLYSYLTHTFTHNTKK